MVAMAAIALQMMILPQRSWRQCKANKPKGHVVATYDYADAAGELLYQVCRYEPKRFGHRQPDGKGGWIYKGSDRRVRYHWPELIAYPDATVFLCEGEKDSDNVCALDLTATTVASGKWTQDCIDALTGRDCWIIQDVDDAGDKKARNTAKHLYRVAKNIKIVRLPGLTGGPGNKDVSDWLEQGHSKDELIEVCASTPDWSPDDEAVSDSDAQDEAATEPSVNLIKSSREFVAGFIPPDYLVDGLLQEAFLYSNTGATGAGKTAIMLRLAASVALGIVFAGRETKKRRVLYLAAENPADVRMRWITLAQQMDFDADIIEVFFVEGAFKISQMGDRLKQEAEHTGGEFGLVIIDTGPVFYEGDDENNRTQQARHAVMLRELIDIIPGRPAVIANVHPVKNAAPDNLLPSGGGSFLNQVDGNLATAKTDNTTELHWQGKYRGVEFAPMHFMLRTATHERLKDSKGRLIPTVVCDWISDGAKEDIAKQKVNDEDKLLTLIDADPKASTATLAIKMEWTLYNGEPNKMKVVRALKTMIKHKLIKDTRSGNYRLTEEGKKALKGEEK
jgi:AAA domain-containing protein